MLERKREKHSFADVALHPVVYQDTTHASKELASMLHPHVEKQGPTLVLALTSDSTEIASNLGRLLNLPWGVIVHDDYVPKKALDKLKTSQIDDIRARLIELDDAKSLLGLKDKNIILVDDCIMSAEKIENIATIILKFHPRKITVTAPTAILAAYRTLANKTSDINITLLTHQQLRSVEEALICHQSILDSRHDICGLLTIFTNNSFTNPTLNSYLKYKTFKTMHELVDAIKKNKKISDSKSTHEDLLVIEKFLSGKEIQQFELSKNMLDDYDNIVKEKNLTMLNDVEIDQLFQFQCLKNLFEASKQSTPSFFSLSPAKQDDKLSLEKAIQAFKNVLLLACSFYMFDKRIENSKMRGKTSWYLLRLLCVIELYRGQSVECLAEAIKAIPYEGILTPLKDKFVKVVDDALALRNNTKLLNVALHFDIRMQDVIQLFAGTITTTHPERVEQLFNAKCDDYMKQADRYAQKAMHDLEVKEYRKSRGDTEFVDRLIKKDPAVVFKAIELDFRGETFNQRLLDLKKSLKPKLQFATICTDKKADVSTCLTPSKA